MIDELKNWLGLISLAITVGGWVWVHLTSGGTKALTDLKEFKLATEKRHVEIERLIDAKCDAFERDLRLHGEATLQRFGLIDLQITKFEAGLEHLPDRKQAHDLAMAVEKMSGQIAAMEAKLSGRIDTLDERLKPVDALGRRIQEMLVRQAEKGS